MDGEEVHALPGLLLDGPRGCPSQVEVFDGLAVTIIE